MTWGILSSLLPDIITTVEIAFSGAPGEEKQAQALSLFKKALSASPAPVWLQQVLLAIATSLIPVFVTKFNADPANTIFIKPPTT